MLHEESNTQIAFVRWFRHEYPELAPLMFSVPNGGRRSKTTAAILKAEGVVAGVADMLFLVARGKYHGLALEFKTEQGRKSPAQKAWRQAVQKQGYCYAVVRSLDDAIDVTNLYLSL